MLEIALWVLVGIVIGWNFPQPAWAKALWEKVKGWFSKDTTE